MLRNFVQIMRSGVVGRKSLGTLPKRLVQAGSTGGPMSRSSALRSATTRAWRM